MPLNNWKLNYTQHLVCSRRRFIPEYIRTFRGFKTDGGGNLVHILRRLNSQRSVADAGQVGFKSKREHPAGAHGESVYHLMLSVKVRYEVQARRRGSTVAGFTVRKTVTQFVERNTEQPCWRQSLPSAPGDWRRSVGVRVKKCRMKKTALKNVKQKNTLLA